MGIFEKESYLDPRYDVFNKYVNIAYKGFWTPAKYEQDILSVDVPHFNNKLGDVAKECIKRCILAVSMVEDKVKMSWSLLPLDIPQTIISDAAGMMAQMEVTHRRSYHSLAEGLKINPDDIDRYPVLRDRIKYLTKYLEKDPKVIGRRRKLKKIALFTALVEKCSLPTQFYILMSFARRTQSLKSISDLQRSTAIEENIHYAFGLSLINMIKEDYPTLWSEHLTESIADNVQSAYDSELALIEWFFEKGVPEHLNKEEVINFLNYNFSVVNEDMGLGLSFKYNEKMFLDQNLWFVEATKAPINPDFFDGNVGGYSNEENSINLNDFDF